MGALSGRRSWRAGKGRGDSRTDTSRLLCVLPIHSAAFRPWAQFQHFLCLESPYPFFRAQPPSGNLPQISRAVREPTPWGRVPAPPALQPAAFHVTGVHLRTPTSGASLLSVLSPPCPHLARCPSLHSHRLLFTKFTGNVLNYPDSINPSLELNLGLVLEGCSNGKVNC